MLISQNLGRAVDVVEARERDVLLAYTPGAVPEMTDVSANAARMRTQSPLAAAAPADAYFVTSDGRGRQLFGRDGRFTFQGGALVDAQGRSVLGFAGPGTPLCALHADAADAAIGFVRSARIEPDGTVWYRRSTIEPRTGSKEEARVVVGRVALARFAAGTRLPLADPQHMLAPHGVSPHIGRPGDGNFSTLTNGTFEQSRVDIDLGLERLQEAYQSLDAMRAASVAGLGAEKTAMDLLK